MKSLKELLIKHEGMRKHPYFCTAGKVSVGVGRNLDDVGLSEDEIMFLLDNDIHTAEQDAMKYPWFHELNEPRRAVIISMIFNMGATRFGGFKQMMRFLDRKDYEAATTEMLDSIWARQVKSRAIELAAMMRTGRWPT